MSGKHFSASNHEVNTTKEPNIKTPARIIGAGRARGLDPSELKPYIDYGLPLIPLHKPDAKDEHGKPRGKSPLYAKWQDHDPEFDPVAHMKEGHNVGVLIPPHMIVLDVDPRNYKNGIDSLLKLKLMTGTILERYPFVSTGSGWHFYMLKPANLDIVETLPDYPGLEFKTAGRQVVAAGSVHPLGATYEWGIFATELSKISSAPANLLKLIARTKDKSIVAGGMHTPEELAEMLTGLKVENYRSHADWLKLMMACHHATGGEGSEEFATFSTSDPQYSDHREIILRRWESLTAEGTGKITHKTLYKELHDNGAGNLIPTTKPEEDFADEQEEGEEEPIKGTKRAKLLKACNDYVWVAEPLCFIRRSDLKKYDKEQWESLHASLWMGEGSLVRAIWKGMLPMRKFEALEYLPDTSEFPDGQDGGRYNIWRPSGVTPKEGDVSWFLEHMEYLMPDDKEREYVLDYLSLLVRKPSVKLHFALLIHGAQGTGKSAIGELMRKIIGNENTVKPSNEEISGSYTGWQERAQLAVIEELMMIGRLSFANRLKCVITDPTLRIIEKYLRTYSIPNYLNLMCFTNHADGLHVESGDRRWLVVVSPAKAKDQEYYRALFQHIESIEGQAAVKHFLMTREVNLDPKGRAPETRAKENMRALSENDVERFLRECYEEEGFPFNSDLLRLEDISYAVMRASYEGEVSVGKNLSRSILKFFNGIGAVQLPRNTNGKYPKYRLWVIRNHAHWQAQGATARIEAYEKHVAKKRKRIEAEDDE